MENSGCSIMIRDNNVEYLRKMYNLFNRVTNGHIIMRDIIIKSIQKTGESFIMDEEKQKDPIQFIQSLLDMKDKYDKLIVVAFDGNKSFIEAFNQVLL